MWIVVSRGYGAARPFILQDDETGDILYRVTHGRSRRGTGPRTWMYQCSAQSVANQLNKAKEVATVER